MPRPTTCSGSTRPPAATRCSGELVLARIIEPTSKLDSLRVLEETGVDAAVVSRRSSAACRCYAKPAWRQAAVRGLRGARRAGAGRLVLYDVSTLYFETDAGDGFREPGFSKERRLEPQITIGLLTDAAGFPLMVEAFEGNKAETATMLPVINAFMAAHRLPDVTVVADAGMISEANQSAIEAAGLSFILGARIPDVPYVVREWRDEHPGRRRSPTGWCSPSPGRPARASRPAGSRRSSTTSTAPTGPAARCAASTSRSPRPSRPSTGKPPVKRNRFITADRRRPRASTGRWRPRPARWPG